MIIVVLIILTLFLVYLLKKKKNIEKFVNLRKPKCFIYKLKKIPFVFIFNAKVACSNIKQIIRQVDNLNLPSDMKIHKHKFNNISKSDLLNLDNNTKIIYFIRNPYDRVLSGYTKISNGRKHILKLRIDMSKNLKHNNKIVNYGNVSLIEWIDILNNIKIDNLENHFIPQTYNMEEIIKKKKIIFYDIEKLNKFDDFLKNKNININLNIASKNNRDRKEILTEKSKEIIYNIYKKDFQLLNYNK